MPNCEKDETLAAFDTEDSLMFSVGKWYRDLLIRQSNEDLTKMILGEEK